MEKRIGSINGERVVQGKKEDSRPKLSDSKLKQNTSV